MKKQINGIFETKKSLHAVLGLNKITEKKKDKQLNLNAQQHDKVV